MKPGARRGGTIQGRRDSLEGDGAKRRDQCKERERKGDDSGERG